MGNPINRFECIDINGVKQCILLQSADDELPVLLILHGGPGYAIMPMFHEFNRESSVTSSLLTGTSGVPVGLSLKEFRSSQ